jgi:TPR repeat protein
MAVDRVTMKKMMKKKNLSKNPLSDSIFFRTMKLRHPIHGAIIALSLGACSSLYATEQTPTTVPNQAQPASNDPETLFQQARALLRGEGVKKDAAQAFKLMQSAADLGHGDAMGGLGYFYSQGISVPKEPAKAIEWFRKGAEKGSAKSQYNLGMSLMKAHEENPDEKQAAEAMEWIRKAAEQKLPEANLTYGTYAYLGENNIAQNYELAAIHFQIAADQGLADAQNHLGAINENGQGMAIDHDQAIAWYRKAALQGHIRAQANLGRTIGTNNADENKQNEALAWLSIASQQGDVTAEKCLIEIEPTMTPEKRQKIDALAVELRKQLKPNTPSTGR